MKGNAWYVVLSDPVIMKNICEYVKSYCTWTAELQVNAGRCSLISLQSWHTRPLNYGSSHCHLFQESLTSFKVICSENLRDSEDFPEGLYSTDGSMWLMPPEPPLKCP